MFTCYYGFYHADDRQHGNNANPFNADVVPTPPNANSGRRGRGPATTRSSPSSCIPTPSSGDSQRRPAGDVRGPVRCQRRDHDRDGASGSPERDLVLPVTGGTGRYAGAHGQLTRRRRATRRTRRSSASADGQRGASPRDGRHGFSRTSVAARAGIRLDVRAAALRPEAQLAAGAGGSALRRHEA
jgi:hypothetical protein